MTTIPRFEIVQGNTGPRWEHCHVTSAEGVRPPVLATLSGDYSCVIGVAGSDIMRAVTLKNDANDRFLAILTPAETASLALGTYLVGIELRNAALDPPLVSEIQYRITIVPEVVPASFEPTPGLAADGLLDFSKASQSGLLALFMEDF